MGALCQEWDQAMRKCIMGIDSSTLHHVHCERHSRVSQTPWPLGHVSYIWNIFNGAFISIRCFLVYKTFRSLKSLLSTIKGDDKDCSPSVAVITVEPVYDCIQHSQKSEKKRTSYREHWIIDPFSSFLCHFVSVSSTLKGHRHRVFCCVFVKLHKNIWESTFAQTWKRF